MLKPWECQVLIKHVEYQPLLFHSDLVLSEAGWPVDHDPVWPDAHAGAQLAAAAAAALTRREAAHRRPAVDLLLIPRPRLLRLLPVVQQVAVQVVSVVTQRHRLAEKQLLPERLQL